MRSLLPSARCCLMLLALAMPALAHAQGTQDQLPDPISAARLAAYADMLILSPQQRHALNVLHTPYRAEFQSLREGEIDAWLKSMRGGSYPRAYIHTQRDLLNRIATIDNRLLDSALPILTDEQVARLQRVRSLRQRERAMQISTVWSWQDAPPFDLSQAIHRLALSVDQLPAIDALLQSYEAALTSKFQDSVDDHFATFDRTFDAYERTGWTDERRADVANYEAYSAVTKPIWNERARRGHALMKDVIDVNRRTIEALRPLLPPQKWRELRNTFISRTYSNVHFLNQVPSLVGVASPYDKALAREDISEGQRATLQAQAEAFEKEVDAAIQALIPRIEHYRDTYVGDHDREEEFKARTALDREVDTAWQALMTRRAADAERIASLIGREPVVVAEVPDPETTDFAQVSHYVMTFGRSEVSAWLPPAISASDLAEYSRWLALGRDQSEQLRIAHERYAEQFAEFKAKHRPIMLGISGDLHAGDTVEGYTAANLHRLRQASDQAQAAQRAIEDAFFAEVEVTLQLDANHADGAGLERLRLARERQWLNCGVYSSETRQAGGRWDGMFDLERMLRRVRGLDLSDPAVDQILFEYEQGVAPLLRARQNAMFEFSRLEGELRVEWQEKRIETGEQYPDMTARHAERGLPQLKQAAKNAADPIAELNRMTVDRLVAALPADAAQRVRRTFERLSWPSIYEDRFSSGPLLATALKLEDLAPQQRSSIENLAAEHHPAYEAIIEKMKTMVELPGSAIYDQANATTDELLAFRHRSTARDRIVFERYELNMRAWQRLKSVLTEEQAKAIGMSATPPEPPGIYDQFGT